MSHYKNIDEDHKLTHSHHNAYKYKSKHGKQRKPRGEYIPVPSTYYDLPIRTKRPSVFYPLPTYSMFDGYNLDSHLPHLPFSPKSHFVGDVGKCGQNWCSIGYVTSAVNGATGSKVFQLYAQPNYINGYLDKYHNYFNYKIIDNHKVDILLNLPADKILRTGDMVNVGGGYGQFKVTINDTGAGFVYIPV